MGVRKFRSVEEIPGPPRRSPLDPENLRLAFGLASVAHGLHPVRRRPGVRKFRSWDEALESRASRAPMSDADRSSRARARQGRAILRKSRLRRSEADLTPISGPDAVSLVRQLTTESWSLAGLEAPNYTRDRIPWRFVPGRSA